jgi:hypothetical protein
VEKRKAVVAEAVKRNAFARALDGAKADPALPDLVSRLMRAEMVQALSLARKAGLATAGFGKVEDALRLGKVAALIHVTGAAPDGRAKLDRLAGPSTVVLDFFAATELDLAFGRENVVHAALFGGGQTRKLLELAAGYARYESLEDKGLSHTA